MPQNDREMSITYRFVLFKGDIWRTESQSGLTNKTLFLRYYIDVAVFLVDQKQWSVRIVHGWYVV